MPEILIILFSVLFIAQSLLILWYQKQTAKCIRNLNELIDALEQEKIIRATIELSYNKQITYYKRILKEVGFDIDIQKDIH